MVLSLFPSLFDYALVSLILLRLATSFIFFSSAHREFKQNKKLGSVVRFVIGALIFVGLYTQGAALAGLAVSIWDLKNKNGERQLLLLLIAVLFSLLFIGPGLFAFDLPL